MDGPVPVLVIVERSGSTPQRARLTRALTTVGSDGGADVRLGDMPPRWALVQRHGEDVTVRLLATGAVHRLLPGAAVVLEGVSLALEGAAEHGQRGRDLPLGALAEALAGAEAPDQALRLLVRGLVEATGADGGAIILREGDGYAVPVAEAAGGAPLPDAAALLSDTIVRDVLAQGRQVRLPDASAMSRYAEVPSVVALRLRSVLCVPMRLGDGVVGAIFLGRRDVRTAFSERHAADLAVLATMAVPVLVHLQRLRARPSSRPEAGESAEELLLGDSAPMAAVRRLVARAGPSDLTVLIHGETGTGKELCARAVHAGSSRAARPMVALNCASVPEGLLASELFGVKKGAFTGAVADRPGRIEQADGSTLFLDEVGDMPPSMQAALLRVLEEQKVTRLGDTVERPVRFRLIAATHKDLTAEVAAGRFRSDMLFRLRELVITLPPLRERGGDVVLLATLFLRQMEHQLGLAPHELGRAALEALRRHGWPGNVRELRAAARRAAVLCDARVVEPAHLQLDPAPAASGAAPAHRDSTGGPPDRPLAEARDAFVAEYVAAVLDRHGGNREAAAAALGISLRSLYRYLSGAG
jgi:transcriptional regulator with GAF, ATPase, and Fis domain